MKNCTKYFFCHFKKTQLNRLSHVIWKAEAFSAVVTPLSWVCIVVCFLATIHSRVQKKTPKTKKHTTVWIQIFQPFCIFVAVKLLILLEFIIFAFALVTPKEIPWNAYSLSPHSFHLQMKGKCRLKKINKYDVVRTIHHTPCLLGLCFCFMLRALHYISEPVVSFFSSIFLL